MYSHAIFTPGWPGWLDKTEEEMEKLRPDSWKGYTIGDNTNKHLSKFPFRLDDEKLMYPFYEKAIKSGINTICIHKGLMPRDYGTSLDLADIDALVAYLAAFKAPAAPYDPANAALRKPRITRLN
jgi:hypothetical protein